MIDRRGPGLIDADADRSDNTIERYDQIRVVVVLSLLLLLLPLLLNDPLLLLLLLLLKGSIRNSFVNGTAKLKIESLVVIVIVVAVSLLLIRTIGFAAANSVY